MNFTPSHYEVIHDPNGGDIISRRYFTAEQVTQATVNTLLGPKMGMAGSIAYLDEGAELYERFRLATLPNKDPSQSEPARLINMHKSALAEQIKDIERLIIVGGGSYESIRNQELALLEHTFTDAKKNKLKEVVIVDSSLQFLKQGIRAAQDFSAANDIQFKIIPILGDYNDISADFDEITRRYESKPKEDVSAALIMTGGTFGNLSGVNSTERFPRNEIDVQLGRLSNFVGTGSTVILDHFTRMETGVTYYNTPDLAAFFKHVPRIMQTYCPRLKNLNWDPNPQQDTFFKYNARPAYGARMIVHELTALADQSPILTNGKDRIVEIITGDTLTMMVSLRAKAHEISERPPINTGLENQFYVSRDNTVMHVFKKVGTPSALQTNDSYATVTPLAMQPNQSVVAVLQNGYKKVVDSSLLRPFSSKLIPA